MQEGEKTTAQLIAELETVRQQLVALQARDSEHRRIETALRQAKEAAEATDRAKSEFVATLSHELRTPLSVILNYVDLLLEGEFGEVRPEHVEPLRRVRKNAQEIFDLISAVLDLSRLASGRLSLRMAEVSVPELLKAVEGETQGLRELSRLAFIWEVPSDLPPLYTDAGKLKVVIKNLIGNAVKFTKEGSITVGTQGHREGIEIRVTDTGIGIPHEVLPTIFEPFQQVDPSTAQGTGLGLHIVKRLLDLLGGKITVESEVGRGSTFCIWVPAHQPSTTTKDR
jgi:signal transduction histidine kinase